MTKTYATNPRRHRLTTTADRTRILITFGRHLKKLRLQTGLSPIEFYYKSGIDASNLSKYERGEREPGLINIILIAKALNITPQKLIDTPLEFHDHN